MTKVSFGIKVFIYFFVVFLWVFSIYKIGSVNLNNSNFWFDESGQFWMSKGLNHYSEPFSKTGGLFDIISQNSKWNLDPGGFTILLHYCSTFNNDPFWLRLLPYIFFVGSCIVLAITVYIVSDSIEFGLFSLFYLPIFIKGDILYFAFELRAYSMEYFGILLSLLLLILYLRKSSNNRLLFLNVVLASFCSSRYSFIVFAFSVSLVSLFVNKFSTKKLLCYLPILLAVSLILLISTRTQLAILKFPEYTSIYMFKNLSLDTVKNIIVNNLLSVNSKYIFVLIAVSIVLFFYSDHRVKSKRNLIFIGLILLIYNLLLCVLSFKGIHPWDVTIRWNLSMQILNVFAFMYLLSFVFKLIFTRKESRLFESSYAVCFIFLAFLWKNLFVVVGNLSSYTRQNYDSIYLNFESVKLNKDESIYIPRNELATWRYLNEYGPLKNRYNYPANTVFGKSEDDENDIMKSKYFILSAPITSILQKLQDNGSIIEKTVFKPNRIFLVKKI